MPPPITGSPRGGTGGCTLQRAQTLRERKRSVLGCDVCLGNYTQSLFCHLFLCFLVYVSVENERKLINLINK